jgi:LAO/AO transport system kinase
MLTIDPYLAQVRAGSSLRALARLITAVENDDTAASAAISALYDCTGRAHIIGITGPPGAGKSSLVNQLAREIHGRGFSVAIVAVDPSSPFTGGAILGDRVRMNDLAGSGIFIRSMASRGRVGGLARTTANVVKLLDAYGFEVILVETVGAGQAEIEIANTAHTTLVIEAPGMGDDVQSIKAGILEIADILVVNKADRPGAHQTVKSLELMLHMGPMGGHATTAVFSPPPPKTPPLTPSHGKSPSSKPSPPKTKASAPLWTQSAPITTICTARGNGKHGKPAAPNGKWQACFKSGLWRNSPRMCRPLSGLG